MRTGRFMNTTLSLTLALVVGLSAARQLKAADGKTGKPGEENRDDPCTHLPDPQGKANGIDKKCPALGSSSGVAKGDFNGDGFADLAIGEPGATISGQASAGDVIILYGSSSGLTAAGKALFYEGPDRSLPGTPTAGDQFGSALASGDFNGDGFSDLAIGVPGMTTAAG